MKIFVVNKIFILQQNREFFEANNVINISCKRDNYELAGNNALRLKFDDVTEEWEGDHELFDEDDARQIHNFIDNMDKSKHLYVNCFAGISRSGAVGYILNEYFNRYLEVNSNDYDEFVNKHPQIHPNPLVRRLLYYELFGYPDYSKMFACESYDDEQYDDMFIQD